MGYRRNIKKNISCFLINAFAKMLCLSSRATRSSRVHARSKDKINLNSEPNTKLQKVYKLDHISCKKPKGPSSFVMQICNKVWVPIKD